MEITKEQASMLADLAATIQEQYNISIGYSNPAIPMPFQRETDFIIYENENSDSLKCYHKDDVALQPMGPYLCRVVSEYPQHDDKVQGLFDRLNNDLMDGTIGFDPGVTRTEDGITIQVTKKRFPGVEDDLFDTNIPSNIGTIYTYALISIQAPNNPRFALAKKIIDEMWPQTKKEPKPSGPKAKPDQQVNIFDILRKFFS